jgi:hypothetical protein
MFAGTVDVNKTPSPNLSTFVPLLPMGSFLLKLSRFFA